jgi:hypothetical protein
VWSWWVLRDLDEKYAVILCPHRPKKATIVGIPFIESVANRNFESKNTVRMNADPTNHRYM